MWSAVTLRRVMKDVALEAQRPVAIDDRPVNLSTGRPAFPGLTASTSMGSGLSNAIVSSNWRTGPDPVGDSGIQRSPSSPTPASGGTVLFNLILCPLPHCSLCGSRQTRVCRQGKQDD